MKTTRSEQVVYTNWVFFDIQNNLCTQHVLSLQSSCTEFANQWTIFCHTYCGLIDARIRASEKDLPVIISTTDLLCKAISTKINGVTSEEISRKKYGYSPFLVY